MVVLVIGIYQGSAHQAKAYSTLEACLYGMNSVFNNVPDKNLVGTEVIKDLQDHTFKVEKITLVKALDSYTCDVVAKDGEGLRSYRVMLEKNTSFKHQYRLIDIKGQSLVSQYQWRDL